MIWPSSSWITTPYSRVLTTRLTASVAIDPVLRWVSASASRLMSVRASPEITRKVSRPKKSAQLRTPPGRPQQLLLEAVGQPLAEVPADRLGEVVEVGDHLVDPMPAPAGRRCAPSPAGRAPGPSAWEARRSGAAGEFPGRPLEPSLAFARRTLAKRPQVALLGGGQPVELDPQARRASAGRPPGRSPSAPRGPPARDHAPPGRGARRRAPGRRTTCPSPRPGGRPPPPGSRPAPSRGD